MRIMQKNTRENFQSPVQIHFEEKKKNENAHKQQTNEQRLKDCQKSPNQMKNGAFKLEKNYGKLLNFDDFDSIAGKFRENIMR